MTIFEAIILAIIEGLTEFLPVSSTGHIVIGSAFMKMESTPFLKLYTVAIQFGAILSVVVLYFKQFFRSFNFYYKLLFAFVPAAVAGFLLDDIIDEWLGNVIGIAIALLVGGIFFLFVGKLFRKYEVHNVDELKYTTAFKIGVIQCIAMFPGVSRSGATIIGGLAQKLSPQVAAEFSFFLAVPTMFAATCHSIFLKKWEIAEGVKQKGYEIIMSSPDNLKLLVIGNIVAFIVALVAIKAFITFLSKKGFGIFGWYRIVLGIVLLILLSAGYLSNTINV